MKYKKLTFFVMIVAAINFPIHALAYQMVKKDNRYSPATFESDLDNDGVLDKVTLIKRLPDKEEDINVTAAIKVESKGKSFLKEVGLINRRESSVELLYIGLNQKNFIALSQPVGIDGWRVKLYSFEGSAISEELSAYSDRPSINVKDVDEDDVDEIVVLSRDTKNNLKEDSYATVYKYLDSRWQIMTVYRTATSEHIAYKDWLSIVKQ